MSEIKPTQGIMDTGCNRSLIGSVSLAFIEDILRRGFDLKVFREPTNEIIAFTLPLLMAPDCPEVGEKSNQSASGTSSKVAKTGDRIRALHGVRRFLEAHASHLAAKFIRSA